jgi:hypothetical protein
VEIYGGTYFLASPCPKKQIKEKRYIKKTDIKQKNCT